jgi:lactoylglutathione lyase
MEISRTGIILNTEKFDECVAFYRDLFDLEILFEEQHGAFRLTCFDFQGSYLMIETGGVANPAGKSISESATKFRFNVENIDRVLITVKNFGLDAEISRNEWGSTINIHDPDGNRIGIRDEPTFLQQIKD